jgi:predicted XRE-type DNA-binding protein
MHYKRWHRGADLDKREQIRGLSLGGVTQQQLADAFGVAQSKISDVVNRRTWRHVS